MTNARGAIRLKALRCELWVRFVEQLVMRFKKFAKRALLCMVLASPFVYMAGASAWDSFVKETAKYACSYF